MGEGREGGQKKKRSTLLTPLGSAKAEPAPPQGGSGQFRQALCLVPVDEALDAFMLGAMDAAIDGIAMLHAVADDSHTAMRAGGRERGDGAFERVEGERAAPPW